MEVKLFIGVDWTKGGRWRDDIYSTIVGLYINLIDEELSIGLQGEYLENYSTILYNDLKRELLKFGNCSFSIWPYLYALNTSYCSHVLMSFLSVIVLTIVKQLKFNG